MEFEYTWVSKQKSTQQLQKWQHKLFHSAYRYSERQVNDADKQESKSDLSRWQIAASSQTQELLTSSLLFIQFCWKLQSLGGVRTLLQRAANGFKHLADWMCCAKADGKDDIYEALQRVMNGMTSAVSSKSSQWNSPLFCKICCV